MKDSLTDCIRNFHDDAVNSPQNMLQSAINKASFGVASFFEDDVDEILKNLHIDSSVKNPPSAIVECDWNCVDEILQDLDWPIELPPILNERGILYPISLGDGVQFASDLLISASEEPTSSMVERTSIPVVLSASGDEHSEHKKKVKLSHTDNSTNHQVAATPAKKTLPFLSAKEKFQLEVSFAISFVN